MTAAVARRGGLSLRIKLTLSYAGLVVVAGIALFTVGFLVLRFIPDGNLWLNDGSWAPNKRDLLQVFVKYTWWAIGTLVVIGLVGGWLLAGFMLRPLDRITAAVRRVGDGALGERIDLPGPRDELTELADAFDAMAARVQLTIEEERRFAANASHELRTPHAIIRTLLEVGEADPAGRDVDTLLRRLSATNDRSIAIMESLLALARGELGETAPVDLAVVVAETIEEQGPDAAARSIRLHPSLRPAVVTADPTLVARLVANLVRNAIVHNVEGGVIWLSTRSDDEGAVLAVSSTGPRIDASLAATLTEPFVRGAGRTRGADGPQGSGLGLAIVSSIVRAHDGALDVEPRAGGGLAVSVRLPASRRA
ncbi:HAMP domain-containing sensor histidine kinase [Microbacterium sp. 1P10UB]|uniref:sensor histidine kinase n=1 Tax=unclassified Microbacterium TaxID=2609290 RepID=UPI0039A0CB09